MIVRDNVCYFCKKTYVVTPHLNCLDETVQMRVTIYGSDEKFMKNCHQILTCICCSPGLINGLHMWWHIQQCSAKADFLRYLLHKF